MTHRTARASTFVLVVCTAALTARADVTEHLVTWVGGDSTWGVASNWNPTGVPNNDTDDVYLVTVSGGGSVVEVNLAITVDTVDLLSNASLDVLGGNLTIARQAGLVNQGQLTVDGRTLKVNGTLANSDLLRLENAATLSFATSAGSLQGGGVLEMLSSSARLSTSGGITLTNDVNHTITGYGSILAALDNLGMVTADTPGEVLTLRTYPKFNAGTLAIDPGAELRVEGDVDNLGGEVTGLDGVLRLAGGAIYSGDIELIGGELILAGGAVIDAYLDLVGAAVSTTVTGSGNQLQCNGHNDGDFSIAPGATLAAVGVWVNQGTFSLGSGTTTTTLNIPGTFWMEGTGEFVMNGAGARLINGEFTNYSGHTLSGQGVISSALVNGGWLHANVNGGTLQLSGAGKFNPGTITVDNHAKLHLLCELENIAGPGITVDAATFEIGDTGALSGGSVNLVDSSMLLKSGEVIGVDLTVDADSTVDVSQTGNMLGNNVVNEGVITVLSGADLEADGVYTNHGQLVVASTGAVTTLTAAVDLTFDGAGELLLSNAATELRTIGNAEITNGADHLIHGVGTISGNLANLGRISADEAGKDLLISGADVVNHNLLEVTNGGRMVVSEAAAAGTTLSRVEVGQASTFLLQELATLTGGTVTVNDGMLRLNRGKLVDATFDLIDADVQVTGSSNELSGTLGSTPGTVITVANGATLRAGGIFINLGSIDLANGASTTNLIPKTATGLTLTGEGELTLGGANTKLGVGGMLTHEVGHTIAGAGRLECAMTNTGLVTANVSGAELLLTGSAKMNEAPGELRAEAGGILHIATDVTGLRVAAGGDLVGMDGDIVVDDVLVVAHDVTVDDTSSLAVAGDLHVLGDFSYAMTNPAAFDLSAATVTMRGGYNAPPGVTAMYADLEVAGGDFGDTPAVAPDGGPVVANAAGYVNNFAIGTLVISAGAHVNLRDDLDNGQGGEDPEALYVDVLELGTDSVLNLNGLHLYYNTLINNGGVFEDVPVDDRFPGDYDGDCSIDVDDFSELWTACFGGPGAAILPLCSIIDLDYDADVDMADFAEFQLRFTGADGTIPGCE